MITTEQSNNNDTKQLIEASEIIEVNPARSAAVRIITRFERSDAYIDILLNNELNDAGLSAQDKSLLTELVYGVIRWRWKLDWVLTGFYRGDYLKCLNIIKNALRVGLYQILYMDKIPEHAAVNEAVEIIKSVQGEKIAGVVNGVLRNIARNIPNIRYPKIEEDVVYYYTVIQSHPRWMIKRWLELFGEEATIRLLEANNNKPFTTIRVNTIKSSIVEIKSYLDSQNIEYTQSPYLEESFIIKTRGINIASSDIFAEGKITIQDTSASLATKLANVKPGDKVIDICAAPGGKSFCLAEQSNDLAEITALDKYPSKLRFISEGAERLGFKSIKTQVSDSTEFSGDENYDIVFVDAPCSGLGTISKKPDIKWKRDRDDIPVLVNTQKELLSNAVKLVKRGGTLVYSTCTIEPNENEEIINWLITEYPEFEIDPAYKFLPDKVCRKGFFQTFPHIHNMDGAFAARLIKKI